MLLLLLLFLLGHFYMAASNSYDEILMPNMMVLGIGAFGKGLGHEALMDGISAFIKETPQGSLLSYAM